MCSIFVSGSCLLSVKSKELKKGGRNELLKFSLTFTDLHDFPWINTTDFLTNTESL